MAFGQKFTRRDSEIEEIRNQKVDDEDDIVENDITGGEVEEEIIDNTISNTVQKEIPKPLPEKTTYSRRPVFKTSNIETATRITENIVEDDEEEEEVQVKSRRRTIGLSSENTESAPQEGIRSRRPNFNPNNIVALAQSVEKYFEDDSGRADEIKNEDVAVSLHVNQTNNTRAEAFKLKKNNRPSFNNKFISAQEISSENYYRDAREQSGMENGLDIRLNTLIDRVCEYLNKKDDEISKIKKEALRNPEAIRGEYQRLYDEVVEPETNKRYETIQSAKKENPDKFIFILVKDDKQKLVGFNKDEYPAFAIYDGVTIKTVSYDRTPFGPPSELFAGDDEEQKKEEIEV